LHLHQHFNIVGFIQHQDRNNVVKIILAGCMNVTHYVTLNVVLHAFYEVNGSKLMFSTFHS